MSGAERRRGDRAFALALVVLGVIVAAVSLVLRGRSRDGATGAIAGVLLGYAGVILVALFRGAL